MHSQVVNIVAAPPLLQLVHGVAALPEFLDDDGGTLHIAVDCHDQLTEFFDRKRKFKEL